MASAIPTTNQVAQATPSAATPASPPNKRDLKSWWKSFKLPSRNQGSSETKGPGIFGVPLRSSITYANVAISLIDENGQSYIYGYVPIVVAKCGVFLKEKATGVEGIFRLSGSEKRIKELKAIFDSPDRYGKGLVWDGYTVHDAANVLRRYLNDLPEPVVPLDLYEKFRKPLRGATKQAVGDNEGPQFVDNFDEGAAIATYQRLITELPPLNRQLLLYILDLLAVFAAKSDENRMNSQNLSAIFQPGMLSHPSHAMAPEEYRLNQCVLIFLIENQDHFLIGMQGTAADEETKKEVESGTPTGPLTPNPDKTPGGGLDRSASNASAGAASVRRDGKVRRNRSVSSRHSRQDGASTPNSPSLVATATPTAGLARSNTVPSKKSPALAGAKFKKNDGPPAQQSPARVEPMTPVRRSHPAEIVRVPNSSPMAATVGSVSLFADPASPPGPSQERLLDAAHDLSTPPHKERHLQSLFQRSSPAEGSEKRQPNKLKKKRIPGALNISAQSSSASLTHSTTVSPAAADACNPMEAMPPPPPPCEPSPRHASHAASHHPGSRPTSHPAPAPAPAALSTPPTTSHPCAHDVARQQLAPADVPPAPVATQQASGAPSEATPRPSDIASNCTLRPDENTQDPRSPTASLHSSFDDGSDLGQAVDEQHAVNPSDKEKKKRWRLSRATGDDGNGSTSSTTNPPHQLNIGSNENADMSTTSVGSGASKPRKSFTNEEGSEPTTLASLEGHSGPEFRDSSSSTKEEPKGPIGWIRNKYREAKENAEQRRNKSPPAADRHAIGAVLMPRGKSLDMQRERRGDEGQADKQGAEGAAAQDATDGAALNGASKGAAADARKETSPAAAAAAHTVDTTLEAPKGAPAEESKVEARVPALAETKLETVPELHNEEAPAPATVVPGEAAAAAAAGPESHPVKQE